MAYIAEQSSDILRFVLYLAAIKFNIGNDKCLLLSISILLTILEKGRNYFQVNILFLYRADFYLLSHYLVKFLKILLKREEHQIKF